jgi:hypothetical protein
LGALHKTSSRLPYGKQFLGLTHGVLVAVQFLGEGTLLRTCDVVLDDREEPK